MRLVELMMIINDDYHAVARNASLPVDMPRIIALSSPAGFHANGYFLIGLHIDYGDLTYGDIDEISKLTTQLVPDEIVDFILSFANIPSEHAVIGFAVRMNTPLLPYDYEISGICPVWGDDLSDIGNVSPGENPIDADDRYPAEMNMTEMRMGRLISIHGTGTMTIGHPRQGGRSFFYCTTSNNATRNSSDIFRQRYWRNRQDCIWIECGLCRS